MHFAMRVNDQDHVATLLTNVEAGVEVIVTDKYNQEISRVVLRDRIPFGNKVAITELKHGDLVYKYGYPIGVTRCMVQEGELVHVHNLKSQKVDIPEITANEVLKLMGVENEMQWEDSNEV